MAAIFLTFLFSLFVCFQINDCAIPFKLPLRFNIKCKKLKLELIHDATRKIQAVQYIKKAYEHNHIFQLSLVASEIKELYSETMMLYVKMENLPDKKHQVRRCQYLVELERRTMQAEHLITLFEDDERSDERRSKKAQRIKQMLRMKSVARMGKAQETVNKKALRAVMKNITDKKTQEWPKVQPRPTTPKLKRKQDYGGFEYDYGGRVPK